ncbi:hypothetical protein LCGC14_2227410 [marine sediment metagenome]|uniref:Uncharacterized protein n=1 Tax=marine sediment metagenome TaxID=412755 RepID=A0A0F9D965_9ZZZZ
MSYKLRDNGVTRLADGADIPFAPANRDWREYQKWIADGNTPLPADPPPVPPIDPDDELDAALAALEGTGATVDQLIAAMRGKTGRAGRVGGRKP